ncbi:hypothetical protein [Ruegeria atlantica]|uniref:hypothetical protein n=1 Tax=Ruegeria atlantica TaxID=81569 RepID=UPI0024941D66|nr:hypothetical protein [Ruegeria atlantica]
MNRHERRKRAAQARKPGVVTIEATRLIFEFLDGDPDAVEVARRVFGSLGKDIHACAACDTRWHYDLQPVLLIRIREGKRRDRTYVGADYHECIQRDGVKCYCAAGVMRIHATWPASSNPRNPKPTAIRIHKEIDLAPA